MLFVKLNINWKILFNGLLGIFSFCGFCPTITESKGKKAKFFNVLLITWSFFHIVAATILAVLAFKAFRSDSLEIASFNNILKCSIMILTYFTTIIESVAVRSNFICIWTRVNSMDSLIGIMLPNYNSYLNKFYKETVKKLIFAMLFTLVVELVIILNVYEESNWRFMWSISIIPVTMSRFRHLHHTLFIETLSCRFRVIKNELKLIVKLTKMESNKLMKKNYIFYEGLFKKLSTIKSVYNTLWETSLFVNRSFGVSQLVNLLQNFIQLTCDLYMVYSFLYKNNMTYITG